MTTPLLTGRAQSTLLNQIHHADLFTLCDWLYEAGIRVDMLLCDLPYGTTACSWDEVIAFEPMWQRFKRVIKPRGAIVLTASQPFTSRLVCSNLAMFKYSLVWNKSFAGNFNLAEVQPMRTHEDICIFGIGQVMYFPQMVQRNQSIKGGGFTASKSIQQKTLIPLKKVYDAKYPVSILHYPRGLGNTIHPTQKPVALFEYLIRTYTRTGEIVLDPCCGSGTTGVAARNCGRQWVMGDSSLKYVGVARNRMDQPYTLPMFTEIA